MKVTAVLITKEKSYPTDVMDVLQHDQFDEILIETECPSVHRRYELALKARNDVIYVQDDDCTIDVPLLWSHFDGRITNAITQHHKDFYSKMGVTLIGFGAFFPKKMVNFDRYLEKYPIDPLFLSQADRVFTYVNQPFNSVVMNVNHLPRATDSTRMSTQPDHWSNLATINERLNEISTNTHN